MDPPAPAPRATVNLAELERQAILQSLRDSGGNRMRASRALGISVRTLRNKLHQYREEAGVQNLPCPAAEFSPVSGRPARAPLKLAA
jgi:DNA-binding NtrC family response regulator